MARPSTGEIWCQVGCRAAAWVCVFVIFLNNIDLAVDTAGFIMKFADDSKAGRVVDSQENREAFKEMFNNLETWSQDWQLQFNKSKCKDIHFG